MASMKPRFVGESPEDLSRLGGVPSVGAGGSDQPSQSCSRILESWPPVKTEVVLFQT